IGFLCYNFPRATVYLGDSGSMLIGLMVGALMIGQSSQAPKPISLPVLFAFLTIPFLDTTAAIIRRKLTGRSIYTTDRGHLHHCMLQLGYSPWKVPLSISLFCLLPVTGGLASSMLQQDIIALACTVAVVVVLIATRMFGHAEFLLVRDRVADFLL